MAAAWVSVIIGACSLEEAMHIKREIKDSAVVLSVEGDVNILSAPDLLKGMVAAIERKPQRLLLNLAAVP